MVHYTLRLERQTKLTSQIIVHIRSKLSDTWQRVTRIQDLRFPFKFSEAFLKGKEMTNVKFNHLKRRSILSSILRTSSVHFDPDKII